MTTRYLGIDVGGTNTKLAVVEVGGDEHTLAATATIPTGPGGDPAEVVGRVAAAGRRLAGEHGPVAAAGAGVPGLFDDATGGSCSSPTCPRPGPGRRSENRWPMGWGCRWPSSMTPAPSPWPRAAWGRPAARP